MIMHDAPHSMSSTPNRDPPPMSPGFYAFIVRAGYEKYGDDVEFFGNDQTLFRVVVSAGDERIVGEMIRAYGFVPIESSRVPELTYAVSEISPELFDTLLKTNGLQITSSVNTGVMRRVLSTPFTISTLTFYLSRGFTLVPKVIKVGLRRCDVNALNVLRHFVSEDELNRLAREVLREVFGCEFDFSAILVSFLIRQFGIMEEDVGDALLTKKGDVTVAGLPFSVRTNCFNQSNPGQAWRWVLRTYGPTHWFTQACFYDSILRITQNSNACLDFIASGSQISPDSIPVIMAICEVVREPNQALLLQQLREHFSMQIGGGAAGMKGFERSVWFVTIENAESRWTLAEQRFLEVFFGEDVILRTRHRRHQRRSPTKVSFNLAANIRYDFNPEPRPNQDAEDDDEESRPPSPAKQDRLGRIARPRTADLSPDLKKRLEGFRELDTIAFIKPGTASRGSSSARRSGSASGRQRKGVSLSSRSMGLESRATSPTRAASAFAFERLRSHKPAVEAVDAGYVLPRRRRPLSNTTRKMLVGVIRDALTPGKTRNLRTKVGHIAGEGRQGRQPRYGINHYLHPPTGPSPGLSLRRHSFGGDHPFGEAGSELQLRIPKMLRDTVENYHRLLSPSKGSKPRIIVRDILNAYNIPKPPKLRGRLTPSQSMMNSMRGTAIEKIIPGVPANTMVFSDGAASERDGMEGSDDFFDEPHEAILDLPVAELESLPLNDDMPSMRKVEEAMRDVGWIFPLDYFFDQDEIEAFITLVLDLEEGQGLETFGVLPKKSGRILSIPPNVMDEWQKVTVVGFNPITRLFQIRIEVLPSAGSKNPLVFHYAVSRTELLLPNESLQSHYLQIEKALTLRKEFEQSVAISQCVGLLVSFFAPHVPPFPIEIVTRLFEENAKSDENRRSRCQGQNRAEGEDEDRRGSSDKAVSWRAEDLWHLGDAPKNRGVCGDSSQSFLLPLLINELRDDYYKSQTKANIISSTLLKPLALDQPIPMHELRQGHVASDDDITVISQVRNPVVSEAIHQIYHLCDTMIEGLGTNLTHIVKTERITLPLPKRDADNRKTPSKKKTPTIPPPSPPKVVEMLSFSSMTRTSLVGIRLEEYQFVQKWIYERFREGTERLSEELHGAIENALRSGHVIPLETLRGIFQVHASARIVDNYKRKLMGLLRELRDSHIGIVVRLKLELSPFSDDELPPTIRSISSGEDLKSIHDIISTCYDSWLSDFSLHLPSLEISPVPENRAVFKSLMADLLSDSFQEMAAFLEDRFSLIQPLCLEVQEGVERLKGSIEMSAQDGVHLARGILRSVRLMLSRVKIHGAVERRGVLLAVPDGLIRDVETWGDQIREHVSRVVTSRLMAVATDALAASDDATSTHTRASAMRVILGFLEEERRALTDDEALAVFASTMK
ncbi:hypothetical protein HDU67_001309 [Dinochytrium kinnereticum]|nr:hypothetical protein HDU67_001309 [Dinochytrium kinnereticum]